MTIKPTERSYSVEGTSTAYSAAFRDASVLSARARRDPDLPLEWAVGEYERLTARMRSLDEHLAYHEYWQPTVAAQRAYFDERNEVVALVRERQRLRAAGDAPTRLAELEREIRRRIAPFRPTPQLSIDVAADGVRVLRVPVTTDIDDDAFLSAFLEGVAQAWCESEAARAQRFRVEVELLRIAADALYPEGAPARGSTIDLDDHLDRFPAGSLVLTTGAESTHSIQGRFVQLGARPVSRRVLAHEFGHLLGFSDAYLRGYEGDPDGRFGARVIEWIGLLDDLMGSPGKGRVSSAMIQMLIDSYDGG